MLQYSNLSQRLLDADYAVRGRIVTRAQQLEKLGHKITYCNIGNPHSFKQKPLTYIREVLSLVEYPELLNKNINQLFAQDSIAKAKYILKQIPEGVGAYSPSAGINFVRQAVADFISRRDGIPSNPDHIILTDGASKAAQTVIHAIIKNPNDGIMLPIPQYPMYSASMTMAGGISIGYYLDEQHNWQLNEDILLDSYNTAKLNKLNPIAITVINPGNPTGSVLSYDNIKMIINFARKHSLSILADEVYQENIYNKDKQFYSFAKVMHDMQIDDVTLFSFHSMSKGYFGECGHRSGYLEIRNISDEVFAQFVKFQSINLCANVVGQIATYLMVTPPLPSEPSYPIYHKEKHAILDDLATKANIIGTQLNNIPGIQVNTPEGAMYAFVQINLPNYNPKADYEVPLDEQYCINLLEETGICVVPGSGFGQIQGTLHFRTTFLPPREQIEEMVVKLGQFHQKYVKSNEYNI